MPIFIALRVRDFVLLRAFNKWHTNSVPHFPCLLVVDAHRYYSMEIEYFMSSLASDVMGILTENFLWMRTLGSTPILENEVHIYACARTSNWKFSIFVFSFVVEMITVLNLPASSLSGPLKYMRSTDCSVVFLWHDEVVAISNRLKNILMSANRELTLVQHPTLLCLHLARTGSASLNASATWRTKLSTATFTSVTVGVRVWAATWLETHLVASRRRSPHCPKLLTGGDNCEGIKSGSSFLFGVRGVYSSTVRKPVGVKEGNVPVFISDLDLCSRASWYPRIRVQ